MNRLLELSSHFESLVRSFDFLPAKGDVGSIDKLASFYIHQAYHTVLPPVQLYGFARKNRSVHLGVFGTEIASADVYLLYLVVKTAEKLLKTPIVIRIGAIGCPSCRGKFLKELKAFLDQHRAELCKDCRALTKETGQNFFGCRREGCQKLTHDSPTLLDQVCERCAGALREILESLESLGLHYDIEPHIPLFHPSSIIHNYELLIPRLKEPIGQGARTVSLTRVFGGPETHLAWSSLTLEQLSRRFSTSLRLDHSHVFVVQIGERSKILSYELLNELALGGIQAMFAPDRSSIKAQLQLAQKIRVPYTVIIGEKEALEGSVIIRETESGAQDSLDRAQLLQYLKARIK